MDPTSFTKTSFCNIKIDNITTNESKQFILNQLSILCSDIKYNSRYAKVFNDQFSKNLKNKHIFFIPYFKHDEGNVILRQTKAPSKSNNNII